MYFSHKCYHLVNDLLDFDSAQQNCEALDSSLVHWDHVAYQHFYTYWQQELVLSLKTHTTIVFINRTLCDIVVGIYYGVG